MEVLNRHPIVAMKKITKLTNTTGRRPTRSDIGPIKSCNKAVNAKYIEIDKFIIA